MVVEVHRRVAVDGDVGVHALVDGRGKREALERGAYLALGERVIHVALVGVIVLAAHHGFDGARLVVEDGHAHLKAIEAQFVELVDGCLLSRLLNGGVDGGLDGEAAREDSGVGEVLLQLVENVVHKVGESVHIYAGAGGLGEVKCDGLRLGGIVLLLRDIAVAKHAVEHRVAALRGKLNILGGVVLRGRVGQTNQHGRLGEGEVARAL